MTLAMTIETAALPTLRRDRMRVGLFGRVLRVLAMIGEGLLVLLGLLIAPLPGPFGLPIAVVGMMLVLRNSYWAKRQFIRMQQARPNWVMPVRRLMRRRPEFAPVFWQQTLRLERLLLSRSQRVLGRWRRQLRAGFRRVRP